MALLTTNDKELLENLYDRYSGLVWHVAMEIVEDDRAAEDLTQDTFLKVAEQIEKIGIVDALQTKCFLMTIIRRKCLDFFRRSVDGSVIVSYSADSYGMFGELYHYPAGMHEKGTMRDIYD